MTSPRDIAITSMLAQLRERIEALPPQQPSPAGTNIGELDLIGLVLAARGETQGDLNHVASARNLVRSVFPFIDSRPPVKMPESTTTPAPKALWCDYEFDTRTLLRYPELLEIAKQPQAVWLLGNPDDAKIVERVCRAASQRNETAQFCIYAIPQRDSGSVVDFSSGGLSNTDEYVRYIRSIAAAMHGQPIVLLEPDALGLSSGIDLARLERINEAIRILTVADVYLDLSSWAPLDHTIEQLSHLETSRLKGYVTNVSNYETTSTILHWWDDFLGRFDASDAALPHLLIDTSRNGNGPGPKDDDKWWCNAPGRALGADPVLFADPMASDPPGLAGYLWVKHPGESDGDYRGAPAGTFMPDYALELIKNRATS